MLSAKLNEMDGDRHGSVTYDEFDKYYTHKVRVRFDALDSDKDGTISPEEWKVFLEIHGIGESDVLDQEG